jgi:hypothetical protein
MHILSEAFPPALHNFRTSFSRGKFSSGQEDFHRTSRTLTQARSARFGAPTLFPGPKISRHGVIL